MISESNVKYCKTLFIDKPFGSKYSWQAKSAVFSKAINYILILISVLSFNITIMVVELLKFTANIYALKCNKRLEKKKSIYHLLERKKKLQPLCLNNRSSKIRDNDVTKKLESYFNEMDCMR